MIQKDKGYVRVSTNQDSQRDSPEHQESFIHETAAREGIQLGTDDFYHDKDSATTIVERTDVKRMIDDAKRGEVRSIWFASLSRFSRDALDAITLKRILVNALKIRVVSIEDGYDSAKKDDELLFGIKSVINQNTSSDISGSSSRGIRTSSLKFGNYIGTIPPFGLSKILVDDPLQESGKRKSLERIKGKAELVELIFSLKIDYGFGDKLIVNYLNGDNPEGIKYPAYKGGVWTITAVQAILENPIYTGYNVHGRYKTELMYDDLTDLMKRRKKLVKQPREKWEWSEKVWFPVVIPLERWEIAQDIRMERGGGRRGGRRAYVNVFAKMIFCKECGSAIVTMASKTKNRLGKEYRYLMCSRRRRAGEAGCSNDKWIPYAEMRDELIDGILRQVRIGVKEFERGSRDMEFRMPGGNYEKDRRKLEKRIEDNRKLLFEIRRQNMLGDLDGAQYEFEKEQYEMEITEADKKLAQIATDERRVLDVSRVVRDAKISADGLTALPSYSDVEKTRPLLMLCVKRIEVDKYGEVVVDTYL
jgi:DNA invertase Pin-like site-specific DNA recombinase